MGSRSKRSARSRPKSDGQTSNSAPEKEMTTTRKKVEEMDEREENLELHPPDSPLIFDPQRELQELLLRWPISSEDGAESLDTLRTQLYERETARCKYQPVEERVCPSKRICRFQLPVDLRELETLSPQSYLCRFCLVCQRRRNLYRRVFDKFDRDRDGLLSLKELQASICELYAVHASLRQIHKLMTLISADAESQFDFESLCVISALTERVLYSVIGAVEQDEDRDLREEADFSSLTVMLQRYSVDPALNRLLRKIAEGRR